MLAVAIVSVFVALCAVLIVVGNRRRSTAGDERVVRAATADAESVKGTVQAWNQVARARYSGPSF